MQRYLLIGDGDSPTGQRLKAYFTARGYRVELATTALECIELMQPDLPDVLVLDCCLLWGGCDGLLEWIKDDQVRSGIPVVMMTENSCRKYHDPAVVSRISRPFDVVDLFKAVKAAMSQIEKQLEATM